MSDKTKTGTRTRSGQRSATRSGSRVGSRVGRYTAPEHSGKYTAPIPKGVRRSPKWFGVGVLVLLVGGLLLILLNYMTVLPGSVSTWYLVVGLVVIFLGFVMATRYR